MSSCILILGTPRSGTSCVAGVVHHLGISMGTNLMPPDPWNPAGYFQDIDFETILHHGIGWWKFPTWEELRAFQDTGKFDIESTQTIRQTAAAIRTLAQARAAQMPLWGVKSNRLVFFLNQLITGAGSVKIIRTSRPEADSIASWQGRSGYSLDDSTAVIRNMGRAIDAALQFYGVSPVLTVDFYALLNDPASGVQAIADACGVPITQEAVDFVNIDFKRFGNE